MRHTIHKPANKITQTKFSIGDLVSHKLFSYRGVIVDIDPEFQLSDDWYEAVAHSRPPKNEPWYHVLVHGAEHWTYVAEQNLAPDTSGDIIEHPMVNQFFSKINNGRYIVGEKMN